MSVVLGCIADDFTGATDLAGILARSGARVSLRIGVPDTGADGPEQAPTPFEVVALKCRTAPADEAVRDALAALAWLREAGARRFFWKYCSTFDSTPDGNIGTVAEALLDALQAAQTVYCPAFPENGRTVYKGRLFVGDEPLDESPMKDHPLTPMRDASLVRLLAPQVRSGVGLLQWQDLRAGVDRMRACLDELASVGIGHVIVDALEDADLRAIAETVCDQALITGGSALALPLPDLYRQRGLDVDLASGTTRPRPGERSLVLSGSCSAMTRAQVQAFAAAHPSLRIDPVQLAERGDAVIEEATAWLGEARAEDARLIYATATPEEVARAQQRLGRARAGDLVEQALATLAREAYDAGVRRFVIAGGETSGAVTQALGVRRLEIGREIAPGVPWTYAQRDGDWLALALKSGNFGDAAFFDTALRALD